MPETESQPQKEMSRGAQTALICGTMIMIAAASWFVATRSDDPCVGLFGTTNLECAASRARAQITGVPWDYESWRANREGVYDDEIGELAEEVPLPPEEETNVTDESSR